MRKLSCLIVSTMILGACAKRGVTNDGTAPGATPLTAPSNSSDGTINGGGGIGIRCSGHLEMLDLFEARQAGLTIVSAPQSRAEAIALVAHKMAEQFWNPDTIPKPQQQATIAKDLITPLFNATPFYNPATKSTWAVKTVDQLPLSGDLGNYTVPVGCRLEQVAFFSDVKKELSIVTGAWNELDWLSKATLAAHEFLYWVDRQVGLDGLRPGHGTSTSESARRFVGRLFSVQGLATHSDGVPPVDQLAICRTDSAAPSQDTYFYAFNRPGTTIMSLVLNVILGRESAYQMRVDFDTLDALALLNDAVSGYSETATLQLTGSANPTGFAIQISKSQGGPPMFTVIDRKGGLANAIQPPQSLKCTPFR